MIEQESSRHENMKIIADFIVRFAVFAILFALAVIAMSFGFPWVFNQLENITSTPLPFEGTLRISILGIHALLLLLAGAWVLARGGRIHAMIWWAFFISYAILGFIFFGDTTHRLLEEFSWIRYSTSAFLILAFLCGLAVFVRTAREAGVLRGAFWLVLAVGFLYGGLDEVMEIHEAIGRFLQRMFSYSGEVTDYVTVGYALVAGAVIFFFIRAKIGEFFTRYRMSAYLFLSGICVYVFSTLLDTLDVFVYAKMRSLAHILTVDPTFVMSDAWYLLWSVKNSLNGFEEVFEHTAALLFFIALAAVLFDGSLKKEREKKIAQWNRTASASALAVCALTTAALVVLSLPLTFPRSVIITKGVRVTQLASKAEGLFHADDLAFYPSQGVIVANEGGGSVYRLKDQGIARISDPKNMIRDPDSVAASERGVFVSDGNAGTIILFDKQGGRIIASRADGLVHPEGIALARGDVYILDESQKSLSRFDRGGKLEIWKPTHPEWRTPEGIAYDSTAGTIYITDDTSGAVFRATFGEKVEKIAGLPSPEDIEVLDDGSMLITDTAWGALFRVYQDGRKDKLVQFGRMYRDTQGVTVDDKGSVYVITADGFASTSFMPSFLFRIDDIRL
ncbi:hypothetical protein HY732_01185 [Candidatus Uhrbacteria bacterium]|nr:hypothetical protein [Candidatus Uhrbacteria bacterium]